MNYSTNAEVTSPWNMSITTENTTGVETSPMSATDFMMQHCPVALYVDRAVTPCWYAIGIIGNLISARVWMMRKMRRNNSSAVYLVTLSFADLIFLLTHTLQELKYAWGVNSLSYPGVCEGYFLLVLCVQYLSPILVLGFTVERYIAVCHPFQKEKFCTTSRAIKVVVCLVFTCLLLSAIQSYFWTYDADINECTMREEALAGGDASIWSIWTWSTETLIFLVVPLVILVFNILVIREVRKISRSGQARLPSSQKPASTGAATTVMLLSVSFYVIFTTLPATLVYALGSEFPEGDSSLSGSQIDEDPAWRKYLLYLTIRKIVEEICVSHYACNFFLYFITGVQFRITVLTMMHCPVTYIGDDPASYNGKYSEVSQKVTWHHTVATHL